MVEQAVRSPGFETTPLSEIVSVIVANHDETFLDWSGRSDEQSGPHLLIAAAGSTWTRLRCIKRMFVSTIVSEIGFDPYGPSICMRK